MVITNSSSSESSESSNNKANCSGRIGVGGGGSANIWFYFTCLPCWVILKGNYIKNIEGYDPEQSLGLYLLMFFFGCMLTSIPSKQINSCNGQQIHTAIYCFICFILGLRTGIQDEVPIKYQSGIYFGISILLGIISSQS